MSVFKKTIKYSKSSKILENKIKDLDESLKRTGILHQEEDIVSSNNEIEDKIEIYDSYEVQQEDDDLYDWRKSFLQESNHILSLEREDERSKPSIIKVENYISDNNKQLIEIRDQIFEEIGESTLLNLPEIKSKISRVLEIYDEIKEGLLNEPPDVKNQDPLTPLNQNFVTVDELNKHYSLFINRIQEQIATIGGGGETKLKYLDDIVGIATNPSAYNNKFLKYDHSIGKFVFATAGGGAGSQTLDETLVLGNDSSLGINVGVSTFNNTVIVGSASTALIVNGDLRVTGIVTIGSNTITIDGDNDLISIGSTVLINGNTADVTAATFTGFLNGIANYSYETDFAYSAETALFADAITPGNSLSGIASITATSFYGDGSGLSGVVASEGNTYYVTVNGSDSNTGTSLGDTFLTVNHALSVASSGNVVRIGVGVFTEIFPLTVPAGVTVRGVGLRATIIQPTEETKTEDCFLLNGETTVEDLTVANAYEPGYAFRFADNMKTTIRSPYIQRVTVLNRGSNVTSSDPYGFDTTHNPPVSYKAGRGILIDAGVIDPTTLQPAMLFNECTFICPNNIALEMTNGARTEWVNCFTYLADQGIYAHDGVVGLGGTGYVRIKTSGFSGSIPAADDEIYYLESNSQSGAYSQVGTALTITKVGHGLTVGDRIYADFTSGSASDGYYRVTGYVGVNTFVVTMAGSTTTSGNISYKESLGFGTVRSYDSSVGLSSILAKGEGLFELPSSRLGKTVTAFGGASLSTLQEKFGTASLLLDGNGDYATVISNTDFGFGTSDFTLESFIRLNSIGSTQTIFDSRSASASDSAVTVGVAATNVVSVSYGSTSIITGITTLTTNTWYHVAVSRSSGSTKLFVDGIQEGSTYSDSNDYGTSKPIVIGSDYSGSNSFAGYIDEVRISNNARYTGTFVPTTTAFVSDGNDRLLLHFDGVTGSVSFTDSSIPRQDVRWVRSGVGIATANRITLADYQQFGAEMRSIGSASVFGNKGVITDGPGCTLRLFAYNFGHIGSGKDFSQDVSLVNQADEIITSNNGKVYSVSIDQSGDFRVGDAFYVNQEAGTVNFGGQDFTINSLSDLNVTDGTNTTTVTPTAITVGNVQITGNQVITTSGDLILNPSGISSTTIDGDLNLNGNLYTTGSLANFSQLNSGEVRFGSVSEKTTLIPANALNVVYGSTGSNIAICTNPSSELVLNVTGIPTDSSFDNHSVLFSVIINNTGTGYGCTAVTLNGVSKPILWAGGSIFTAGITTTNGIDIYNFTGINTVGSASTTDNYIVLGTINGGFR
jgi:hypothetical protein